MNLAFLLYPEPNSPIILCRSLAPLGAVPEMRVYGAGECSSGIFKCDADTLKDFPGESEFRKACVEVLHCWRDLEFQILSLEKENLTLEAEELFGRLEKCQSTQAINIFAKYRALVQIPDLNIILLDNHPANYEEESFASALGDRLRNEPRTIICYQNGKSEKDVKQSCRLNSFESLLNKGNLLEQKLDKLGAEKSKKISDRLMEFTNHEELASLLHLSRLDAFFLKTPRSPKVSAQFNWLDVYTHFTGCPEMAAGEKNLSILSGSILDQSLRKENRRKLIFENERDARANICHVILQGYAGTGKSTLGHLIMLHDLTREYDDLPRVAYMGPTRMLVEERYECFRNAVAKLAAHNPDLGLNPADVVISTGEHNENDEKIRCGNFRAMFIVYEKLNNISINSDLLRKLSCVIVDEIQMISEPTRGGMLDIVFNAICAEANMRTFSSPSQPPLRIIVCTTENFDLEERMILKATQPPNFVERRPPLVLKDNRRFLPVSGWYHPFNKKAQYFPASLELPGERKQKKAITGLNAHVCQLGTKNKLEKITWLREWLWERRHVLYVSADFNDMFTLARQLLRERPVILEDREWLENFDETLGKRNISQTYKNLLLDFVEKGIFFNFTEMGNEARKMSTSKFRDITVPAHVPLITFATSTIMYGVNLPADMMILGTLTWPRKHASKFGSGTCQYEELPSCAAHNFIGRVGRVGLCDPDLMPLAIISESVPPRLADGMMLGKKVDKIRKLLSQPQKNISTTLFSSPQDVFSVASLSLEEQQFLLNAILYVKPKFDQYRSLTDICEFISLTWTGNKYTEDIWQYYIKQFYIYLSNEFDMFISVLPKDNTVYFYPQTNLHTVCKTGTPLSTLKEMMNIFHVWNIEEYPEKAHIILVIISFILTSQGWELFADIHLELAKWKKGMKLLTPQQKDILNRTKEQEKMAIDKLKSILGNFMPPYLVDKTIYTLSNIISDESYHIERDCVSYLNERRTLIIVRSILMLISMHMGLPHKDIRKYRLPNITDKNYAQNFDDLDPYDSIFELPFKENYQKRIFYSFACLYDFFSSLGYTNWLPCLEQARDMFSVN